MTLIWAGNASEQFLICVQEHGVIMQAHGKWCRRVPTHGVEEA